MKRRGEGNQGCTHSHTFRQSTHHSTPPPSWRAAATGIHSSSGTHFKQRDKTKGVMKWAPHSHNGRGSAVAESQSEQSLTVRNNPGHSIEAGPGGGIAIGGTPHRRGGTVAVISSRSHNWRIGQWYNIKHTCRSDTAPRTRRDHRLLVKQQRAVLAHWGHKQTNAASKCMLCCGEALD